MAERGIKPSALESLFETPDAGAARAALVRIAASVEIANLLNEIESSTSRISDLVGAIKEYTFMDQSPLQNVDVVKSLETTLTIQHHKLKRGITVQRDYQPVPLLVNSFGSELNQVWPNLMDNAIDAMTGKGELRVRTYRDPETMPSTVISLPRGMHIWSWVPPEASRTDTAKVGLRSSSQKRHVVGNEDGAARRFA